MANNYINVEYNYLSTLNYNKHLYINEKRVGTQTHDSSIINTNAG